jgi:hypothetical protein
MVAIMVIFLDGIVCSIEHGLGSNIAPDYKNFEVTLHLVFFNPATAP